MSVVRHRNSGTPRVRQWANLFAITNLHELSSGYRLLYVRGLARGERYDKNVNRLAKSVAYEIKQPVALTRCGNAHALAIPAGASLPSLEQQLMPDVATLVPEAQTRPLNFMSLDYETGPIAINFLQFALRAPLREDPSLWGSGRAFYRKDPLDIGGARTNVDVYPGFVWNLVIDGDSRVFLALDTTVRYVDHRWLPERLDGDDPNIYRLRSCLYHFGHQWYMVQLLGGTDLSIAAQRFMPNGRDEAVDVLTYTRNRWPKEPPLWIRDLDPESPAIIYCNPGNDQERYGALALCKLALRTADVEAAGLHRESIQEPALRIRVEDASRIAARYFGRAKLNGVPIRLDPSPAEVAPRAFEVPAIRFGQDRVLAVQGTRAAACATDVVPLEQFGSRRVGLLLSPSAGPIDQSPFDAQYILLPLSQVRAVNEDFARRFERTMREISGQEHYRAEVVFYDDRSAKSLYQQVQAIKGAIAANAISRGYALLVLPESARSDLHNYIKRELWPDVQFQCAMAGRIRSYYQPSGPDRSSQPAPDRMNRFNAYLRNCALGMMMVNRKWLWTLATPLHYDLYIGVDVLNGTAGFTFVYNGGEQLYFRDYPCKQRERLTTAQMREILVSHLREDINRIGISPRSIVVHRDGRTFSSELQGLHAALQLLKDDGTLEANVVLGVVDIRKDTVSHIRLFEGIHAGAVENPTIGSHYVMNDREGITCNTGRPFRLTGTTRPLAAVVVEGPLDIDWVLDDILALSLLAFSAPDKCARLPITIKLADDFLEPIAGDADDEQALYDTAADEEGTPNELDADDEDD